VRLLVCQTLGRKRLAHAFACALSLALLGAAPRARAIDAGTPAPVERKPVVVFAASSLREGFTALGHSFTALTGVDVQFNFAGSQELRTQLEQGAQADLFASADLAHAAALQQEGLARAPENFARNALTLIVPRGNPEHVRSLADLARLDHLVIGAHEVPAGAYAEQLFALADSRAPGLRAKLEARVSSREPNVRQVVAKVALGEADAGIVYRTDARAMADRVSEVPLPPELELRCDDAIAALVHAPNSAGAAAFLAFVLSPAGQAELQARGFLAPGAP